ncbi:class A beta-lactamase [Swaminathania salitolerans]|uniref:Beta-lactamase n=1 Tax=Swaminathania salitolerans TaxID=182838 RepID=A0A511BUH1_9PROT|nr:class A beta-lactamase [Swaminathania salitolerans]GBQ16130.1 beta-lactamase class A [Swaminathania salitolerans LMG 21291]GEL01608.1 hypothetical protein SSA02_07710 [Swaminathania salitolerans]
MNDAPIEEAPTNDTSTNDAPTSRLARRSFLARLPLFALPLFALPLGIPLQSLPSRGGGAVPPSARTREEQERARRDAQDLARLARNYERRSGGRIGIAIRGLSPGRMTSWRGHERFLMCSTFKVSLVACILARCEQGADDLTLRLPFTDEDIGTLWAPVIRENRETGSLSLAALCAGAITVSDNVCANLLLRHLCGPRKLTQFWREEGDRVSRLDACEPALNHPAADPLANTTSPCAMTGTLDHLLYGSALNTDSKRLLRGWMTHCRTGTSRLRSGFPPGWTCGDKTGSNGKDIAADIAFARPVDNGTHRVVISTYTAGGAASPALLDATFREIGALATRRIA